MFDVLIQNIQSVQRRGGIQLLNNIFFNYLTSKCGALYDSSIVHELVV